MGQGSIKVVNRHVVGTQRSHFYVGRPSLLGNPFKTDDRAADIENYRLWLVGAYETKADVREVIDGFVDLVRDGETIHLACWCAPRACHADVVRDFVLARV